MQSIEVFTLALAGPIFCATWVFTSSPRIAYAGRQMAGLWNLSGADCNVADL
jgi:hypothetical protein